VSAVQNTADVLAENEQLRKVVNELHSELFRVRQARDHYHKLSERRRLYELALEWARERALDALTRTVRFQGEEQHSYDWRRVSDFSKALGEIADHSGGTLEGIAG
jgi:hypothetical protein